MFFILWQSGFGAVNSLTISLGACLALMFAAPYAPYLPPTTDSTAMSAARSITSRSRRRRRIFLLVLAALLLPLALLYRPDVDLDELKALYAQPPSRFIKVGELDVHYRDQGPANAPVLVLLHGTAASLHTWDAWTHELQGRFRIIRMDLPGFGLTGPNSSEDYSIEAYTSFLNQFLNALDIDSCYLGGNSLGGNIAWAYAVAYPQQVRKLVLLDASGYPFPDDYSPPLGFRMAMIPIISYVARGCTPRFLFGRSLRNVYYNDSLITDSLIDRYYNLARRPGNRRAFVQRVQQIDRTAQPVGLGTLPMPTLIQWGEQDTWVPLEHGHRFDADIPYSKLIVYPQCGHLPMEDVPQKSANDAAAFLLGL